MTDDLIQHMFDPTGKDQHQPGAKLDGGKPDCSLLVDFGRALLAVSAIGTYGAKKYTRGGWQTVPDARVRYTAAMIRHQLMEQRERNDPESNLTHAAHLAWNALARLELMLREEELAAGDPTRWPMITVDGNGHLQGQPATVALLTEKDKGKIQ